MGQKSFLKIDTWWDIFEEFSNTVCQGCELNSELATPHAWHEVTALIEPEKLQWGNALQWLKMTLKSLILQVLIFSYLKT